MWGWEIGMSDGPSDARDTVMENRNQQIEAGGKVN